MVAGERQVRIRKMRAATELMDLGGLIALQRSSQEPLSDSGRDKWAMFLWPYDPKRLAHSSTGTFSIGKFEHPLELCCSSRLR